VGIMLSGKPPASIGPAVLSDNTIDHVARVGIMIIGTKGHTLTGNRVTGYGRRPFKGSKRKNRLQGNSFGPNRS